MIRTRLHQITCYIYNLRAVYRLASLEKKISTVHERGGKLSIVKFVLAKVDERIFAESHRKEEMEDS